MEKFLSKYATEERVLDLGSGGSSYGKFFPNRVTVDIDPARKPSIVADANSLPFRDGEFGYILCTEMLEHVKDPFQVEMEIRRVMSTGGVLILSTRFIFPIHDSPNDYWRFTPYALKLIFREWEVLELTAETRTFETLAVLLQRIAFQTTLKLNKPMKGLVFIASWLFKHLDGLIKMEYGDIGRTRQENNVLSSGYYLVCKKI